MSSPWSGLVSQLISYYANGIFGSRRIDRATYRDIGLRYVASYCHPDHETNCAFRRNNFEAVAKAFEQVLFLSKELKLLLVEAVTEGGTKVDANANKRNNIRHDDRAKELRGEIKALLARVGQEDSEGASNPQALPQELTQQERLRGQRQLFSPSEASSIVAGQKDSDSALMRKSKQHEYRQAHNAQALVDADGSQLLLGARAPRTTGMTAASWWRTWTPCRHPRVRQRVYWRTRATPRAARWRNCNAARRRW